MHERFARYDALQQWNKLRGRNQLLAQPERLDFGERIVDTELIEVDGAVKVDQSSLSGGDLFEAIEQLLRIQVGGVVEDRFGGSAGFVFVAEGLLTGISDFEARLDGRFEEFKLFGQGEERGGVRRLELCFNWLLVGGRFLIKKGAALVDFDRAI